MIDLWTICAGVTAIVAFGYAVDLFMKLNADPKEPRYVLPKIPLIGHLLGMIEYGTGYYSLITPRVSNQVFYTLPMLNLKIYVPQDTKLIAAVQRAAKTLSFTPFFEALAKGWCNLSPRTVDLFSSKDGGIFLKELDTATRNALAPGPGLDRMNHATAVKVLSHIDELIILSNENANQPHKEGFHNWIKRTITIASTRGLYGPLNPFADPEVYNDFWTYDKGIPILTTNICTSILARRSLAARARLISALEHYYLRDGPSLDGSLVVQERYRVPTDHAIPLNDIARIEAAMEIALLTNTVPSAFWSTFDIISRPTLLSALRDELSTAITRTDRPAPSPPLFTLDVAAMKSNCKLLLSAFQETQRTMHTHANIRKITADTLLGGSHLVKKGHYVQIPNAPIHRSTAVWGPDADIYDPTRFLVGKEGRAAPQGYSFLAWGLAPSMCPARQFATTEILILVALLVMRLDVVPVHARDVKAASAGGKGGDGAERSEWESTWVAPPQNIGVFSTIWPPKTDIDVEFAPRKDGEWANGEWDVKVGESASKFPLASG